MHTGTLTHLGPRYQFIVLASAWVYWIRLSSINIHVYFFFLGFVSWDRVLFCKLFALELAKILLSQRPPPSVGITGMRHHVQLPYLILYVAVFCLHITLCACLVLVEIRRGSQMPGIGIMGGSGPPWEPNADPLVSKFFLSSSHMDSVIMSVSLGTITLLLLSYLCCSCCNKIKHKLNKKKKSKIIISSSSTLRSSVPGRY